LPINLVEVKLKNLDRVNSQICYLCKEPMGKITIGDLIVIKMTRKSRYAHLKCAIRYNWVDKSEIQKEYLLPLRTKMCNGE